MMQNQKNRKLVVIDGNSLINRAYYAIQRPMITTEGLYTQGVYGFLNILQKIRNDYEPGYIVVAFDLKGPTFRHEEFADYKAGRKKMPPELAMQLPLLKEVLESMKIKILELEGFEADDIIGTVAKKAEEEGFEPMIITGDKDALQLATHITQVIITRKGISEFDSYDYDAMMEKYGFSPEQFIDFKGLMGDPSDNIPGIPGVGEKTAQKLILEYGSVANLIENAVRIKNEKLRQKIEENTQVALMSRRLAEINKEVPIDLDLESFIEEEPDYNKLLDNYKKLEFNSFIKKLKIPGSDNKGAGSEDHGFDVDGAGPRLIKIADLEALDEIKTAVNPGDLVAIKVFTDNNHQDIPSIEGIALSTTDKCFYLDGGDKALVEGLKSLIRTENYTYIGHGLKEDYYALISNGLYNWEPVTGYDTEIAQYLLWPGRRNYDFNTLYLEYFHIDLRAVKDIEAKDRQLDFLAKNDVDYAENAAEYCGALFQLHMLQSKALKDEGLDYILNEVELPLVKALAHMEAQGISVEKKSLMDAGKELTQQINAASEIIISLAGEDFNINSPKQLGEILFDKLKLPVGKKTKTGYSTNAEVLENLRGEHEIIDHIFEYRTLTKLNGTYVEGLLPLIHKDGKIHAHFQQTITATGRISCTEPNLQNIPVKQEIGRQLRKVFVAEDENRVLVGADYSQIELRVLAHLSEDPALIEAFEKGADIHRATAARVFGVPESEVTPLQRSNAKAVNFGVIYGMSGFGLASELNISRKMAESYIDEYFSKHAKVKEYMDRQVAECRVNGYVTTIMNRKRLIPEINASNYVQRQAGERLAMNTPIQGSAADIIKLAMIRCHNQLMSEGLKSRLILQVHDELIIHAGKDELERVKQILRDNMENALSLKVPLSVELNVGENWYELK